MLARLASRLTHSLAARRRLLAMVCLGWLLTSFATAVSAAEPNSALELVKWEYYEEIALAADLEAGSYCDVILPISVFEKSRLDLGDLRLYDAAGVEVPYALRVRRPDFRDEKFQAREFNRSTGPDKSIELSLDLEANPQQHNQVELETSGVDFRRRAEVDGSDDGQQWRRLVEGNLVHFISAKVDLNERRLTYPPSRFRYLRIRLYPDPVVDVDKEPIKLLSVSVHRKVEVPGEMVTLPAAFGPREPVKTDQGPGSGWILDLGGHRVPVQRIKVEVSDDDFARPYEIEAAGRPDWTRGSESDLSQYDSTYTTPDNRDVYNYREVAYEATETFTPRTSGLWRRLAGELREPLVADFDEVRASRLRLKVTDNRNPPLDLKSVDFVAPARQLVFAHTAKLQGPLRLYFGNPRGTLPRYDLERNLPAVVVPAPTRMQLGSRQTNPQFVPEPKPLTERWPWLIYLVLGVASSVLAVILVDLGRSAVTRHDAQQPVESAG